MAAITISPPTTPPTIPPIGEDEDELDGVEVVNVSTGPPVLDIFDK